MRVIFVAALACALAACSGGSSPSSCVPGASVACSCANGKTGAQVCASNGTLGVCSCAAGTGGSGTGGATATGGATGMGGAPATGGATGTGGTPATGGTTGAGGQTSTGPSGQFTVVYDGSITKSYSSCYTCVANYYAQTSTGALGFSYNGGVSGISIEARVASAGGYEINAGIEENDSSVPTAVRGSYDLPGGPWVPQAGGCITFTQLSLKQGGGLAGSLNCSLTGGNDTTPHTAVLQGTFQGIFP